MQLITILLTLTAILTFASGLSVLGGSSKSNKKSSKFFTFSVFFAALWTISVAFFLSLTPTDTEIAKYSIYGIYIPALFMDVCLMVYVGYPYKFVRGFGLFMAMGAAILSGLLIYDSSILYSNFTLSHELNSVALNLNWFYYCYAAFYFINTIVLLAALIFRVKKTKNRGLKNGLLILGAGTAVAGSLMLIFDVLLPLKDYSLIWIGPMALSIVMISHYYAVLKYRIIKLNSGWLKALSYAIILATVATVYMLFFYIIFTAIFKTPNPSSAIIIFNVLMALIFILLIPAINEISSFVRSLISTDQVDLIYVTKKLDLMQKTKKVNLNELAGFLADHLHFTYVGLIINEKLYGSEAKQLSSNDLKILKKLDGPKRGVWQTPTAEAKEVFDNNELTSVAILTDEKDHVIGQIIFGKVQNKVESTRRELIQLEMLIRLASIIVEKSKKDKK